ncbi:LGFP repeat-containing protein [Mycobacterium sp. MUNTM1]
MCAHAIRTATVSVAIASFALFGVSCQANKSGQAGSSTTSPVSSAATSSSATAGTSAATTPNAPGSTTQIPGANGTPYTVQGPILTKYQSLDDKSRKDLGAPKDNQQTNPDGGIYQQFDDGVIVYKAQAYVVWGLIRDKWNELGGSQGKLGYPTSDEVDTPDGMKKSTFEHGAITWKPGDAQASVTYS